MDKKKRNTILVFGVLSVLCYIIFEILYLYSLYSQRGLSGAISEEVAEQIKNRGNIRNLFELGCYILFLMYSWYVWRYSTEKKYKKYFIFMAYVIVSVFALGFVFGGIQYLLMGTSLGNGNPFMPGVILIWFAVLSLLLTSGMQAKKDKEKK